MNIHYLLCITLLWLCHPQLGAQTLTKEFPRPLSEQRDSTQLREPAADDSLPDAPNPELAPVAEPEAAPPTGVPVRIRASNYTKRGDIYTLTGEAVIEYRDYILRADKITYNAATDEAEGEGHLQLEGGADNELVTADRGSIQLARQTGHFYGVTGTIGVKQAGHKAVYTSANPLLFTGREVVKSGPDRYTVLGGSMTSCRLPRPDWQLLAARIDVADNQARAANTRFQLLGIPLFYLPYATHPVDSGRQSGILIPTLGTSSTKGTIVGESIYWAISRNSDLTLGAEYYSKRGFAPDAQFRYRGTGMNFLTARFDALLDHGLHGANQGGTHLLLNGRRDFDDYTRAIVNIEYLSSYVYRLAFTESFAQAVNSQVKSDAFLTHSGAGLVSSVRFDRYQSFENTVPNQPFQEIRILHLPSLEFESLDQPLGPSGLYGSFTGSMAALSRSEPGFQTSREIGRLDLSPRLSWPLHLAGWTLRPEAALRDTFYTKSQRPGVGLPVERGATTNRGDFEAGFEIRPPVIERVFDSGWLVEALHRQIKHTIEAAAQYRYIVGIGDFNSILRFDETDIASNTNEVLYSLTQRLFLKSGSTRPCKPEEIPATAGGPCGGGARDWITWQVAQKYFADPHFGGALTPGRRNVLASSLDLTGVAFLVSPRDISPVLSRLRLRGTENTGLEWDLDYDTRAGRIAASNLFADYRHGNLMLGIGHAHLDAPEETPSPKGPIATVVNFNQLRLLAAYGNTGRRGFNVAANSGYDFTQNALQYGGIQTSYNWECCGFSVEYRRFALGSFRNENQYRFNFTLAGVGTAGNLRRAERIF